MPIFNPHAIAGSNERERVRTVIVPDHLDLARLLADRMVDVIHERVAATGRCVLGLATGSTPLGIYRELIRRFEAGDVDFSRVITFNLDEYYGIDPESRHSYHRYMRENLFDHVNIPAEQVHVPDGLVPRDRLREYCGGYEKAIRDAGGIDFQLLGLGKTGHIGFNEPGSSKDSVTRLVTLDTVTRKDAAADFFGEDNVPREAITMGVATILAAREIALIATGEHKSAIVRRAVEGEVTPEVAATYLQLHSNAVFYLDLAAAADLTRVATPWILGPVEWTVPMTDRAVVWLAETTGKAILKLSARDYTENHLSPLLARYGSPGVINGAVFNRLRDKIRGRARLPRGRRIVVFSPHPDDDVISMGGLLRKLWENENQITVAYMTSGNIAVFDHDVRRYFDFVDRAGDLLGLRREVIDRRRQELETSLAAKEPGAIDIPLVQDIKRVIRECEAVSALATIGMPAGAARFLNLPFYRTGEVRKRPITDDDVAQVRALLDEVQPELVFIAGDLSDPHGTHRMCMEAIEGAMDREPAVHAERWYYRGAWQEWSLTEADVLVPLSYEELRAKVNAIFRHESQKDAAPFPGAIDDREFWQRVEARNQATAARADRLGLPEYYAMEAYVAKPPAGAVASAPQGAGPTTLAGAP
jgi:glucosamine-6-phosphate deaminase